MAGVDPTSWSAPAAFELADRLAEVEIRLLEALKLSLSLGLDVDDWEIIKARQFLDFHRKAEKILAGTDDWLERELETVIAQAVNQGIAIASAPLGAQGVLSAGAASRILALALEDAGPLKNTMRTLPGRILRDLDDAYREITANGMTGVLSGVETRREAVQRMLNQYAARGITHMRDKSGRNWRIDTYTEMAARTAIGHATVTATTMAWLDFGYEVVEVSDAPRECPKCTPWERARLSLTGETGWVTLEDLDGKPHRVYVKATLEQAREQGLWHPNCFPAETLVQTTGTVDASDSRWYEGEVVVIKTASGDELTVTPNHPILTPEGWVYAGALREGMNVVRHNGWAKPMLVDRPDEIQVPTRIGDVHGALKQAGTVATVSVPVTSHDFHGDGIIDTQVEVVFTDRLLQDNVMPELADEGSESSLLVGGVGLGPLFSSGAAFEIVDRSGHAANGVVGRSGEIGAFCRRHSGLPTTHGFAEISSDSVSNQDIGDRTLCTSETFAYLPLSESFGVQPDGFGVPSRLGSISEKDGAGLRGSPFDSELSESVENCRFADAVSGGELCAGLSGEVTLSEIVQVDRRNFAGHVYNLETSNHWYLASSIVVHNCRHRVNAYIPGVTRTQEPETDPTGYQAGQQQRYMERQIRKYKRQAAASLTLNAKAEANIRHWQSELLGHIKNHPELKRLRYREETQTTQ